MDLNNTRQISPELTAIRKTANRSPSFAQKLKENPKEVFAKLDYPIPDNVEVKVIFNQANEIYIPFPAPSAIELSESELEFGGGGGRSSASTVSSLLSCVGSASTKNPSRDLDEGASAGEIKSLADDITARETKIQERLKAAGLA